MAGNVRPGANPSTVRGKPEPVYPAGKWTPSLLAFSPSWQVGRLAPWPPSRRLVCHAVLRQQRGGIPVRIRGCPATVTGCDLRGRLLSPGARDSGCREFRTSGEETRE